MHGEIRHIINNLHLSESLSLQLPCILKSVYHHAYDSRNVTNNYLNALNMHVMSFSEFNTMDQTFRSRNHVSGSAQWSRQKFKYFYKTKFGKEAPDFT